VDGEQAGIMDIRQAQEMAEDVGLDLVEIAPNGEPPVCRIMDYGKFRFEQAKKASLAKKKQKLIQVKEVKFRPGTEEADYQVKMRNVRRFLDEGDKVKVTLRFRGRELAHKELGAAMLKRIETELAEDINVEQYPPHGRPPDGDDDRAEEELRRAPRSPAGAALWGRL
jgi:translation initiation factor IF-3